MKDVTEKSKVTDKNMGRISLQKQKHFLKNAFILVSMLVVLLPALRTQSFAAEAESTQESSVAECTQESSVAESTQAVYIPDRGELPLVRNQGRHNLCWAFSAISCAEINMLKQGKSESPDYSEVQLAYYTYNQVSSDYLTTQKGNHTDGDENNVSQSVFEVGGNNNFAAAALASWKGLVDEEQITFTDETMESINSNRLADEYAYTIDSVHMTDCLILDTTDIDGIKESISSYGAASANIYYSAQYLKLNEADGTYSYYNTMNTTRNHAVTIVGWDDNYSADNFKYSPGEDGAWLVRNSFGSDFADGGYFYISYYETSLNKAYIYNFDTGDNYDNNYQYDGAIKSGYIRGNGYLKTVVNYKAESDESLEAVMFLINSNDVDYQIKVDNLVAATGHCGYAGYHTIKLNQSVLLSEGDTFSIAIELSGEANIDVGVEMSEETDWYSSVAHSEAGRCFYALNRGDELTDYGALYNADIRVKAFTKNRDVNSEQDMINRYVENLYGTILLRHSDEAGLKAWVSAIADGTYSPAEVCVQFFGSTEYTALSGFNAVTAVSDGSSAYDEVIGHLYKSLLLRNADATETQLWSEVYERGVSLEFLIDRFVGSSEFEAVWNVADYKGMTLHYNRDLNIDNTAKVTVIYKELLKRIPDEAGLNLWCGMLNAANGINEKELRNIILSSKEYHDLNLSATSSASLS